MTNILHHRSLGIGLIAASLVALLLSVYTNYQHRTYQHCHSRITEAQIQASIPRAKAAEEDRQADRQQLDALVVLVDELLDATTLEEVQASRATYDQVRATVEQRRAAAETDRAANPYPEPPSTACA